MTVKVTKPAINVREELADLRKPSGIAGEAMLRAETPQEQFNLIGAGRRNLIVNSDMRIAQRGTSATGLTSANEGYKTVDRLNHVLEATSELVVTSEQSTDAPDGFSKSVKLTVTTPETAIGSAERFQFDYKLEGQNVQSIGAGTTSAQQLTVSFWVKSSVTGTYSTYIYGYGGNRIESHTYNINVAATWEQKTITFSADTTTANYADTSVAGLELGFLLSAGSGFKGNPATTWEAYTTTNLADGHTADVATVSGATWQITGVQLELGKVATPFEHRSYGEELAACKRFFQVFTESGDTTFGTAVAYTGNAAYDGTQQIFPVEMRASPTRSTSGSWYASDGLGSDFGVTSFYGNNTKWGYQLGFGVSSGLTTGRWYSIRALNGSGSQLKFDAEL